MGEAGAQYLKPGAIGFWDPQCNFADALGLSRGVGTNTEHVVLSQIKLRISGENDLRRRYSSTFGITDQVNY